jgi:hypothetical protein
LYILYNGEEWDSWYAEDSNSFYESSDELGGIWSFVLITDDTANDTLGLVVHSKGMLHTNCGILSSVI